MAKNNEKHARLLMKELKELSDKYGTSYFEEEHLEIVVESLDEMADEILEPIMKDPLARAALASTIITLATMEIFDSELEEVLLIDDELNKKKKQTTH